MAKTVNITKKELRKIVRKEVARQNVTQLICMVPKNLSVKLPELDFSRCQQLIKWYSAPIPDQFLKSSNQQ